MVVTPNNNVSRYKTIVLRCNRVAARCAVNSDDLIERVFDVRDRGLSTVCYRSAHKVVTFVIDPAQTFDSPVEHTRTTIRPVLRVLTQHEVKR